MQTLLANQVASISELKKNRNSPRRHPERSEGSPASGK